MNEHDDNIAGIFDNLTPLDFHRDTSARHVAVMNHFTFGHFVEQSLESTRIAFHAADGEPNPIAILLGPDGRRIYTPDDDETLAQYIERLKSEVKRHKIHGIFTFWVTEGSAYQGGEQKAVGSAEGLAEAGELRPCLYWFAQEHEEIRHGIMTIDDEGNTAECYEAPAEHASPVYRDILGG